MREIKLEQASSLVINGKTVGPGETVSVEDKLAKDLVAAGSAHYTETGQSKKQPDKVGGRHANSDEKETAGGED